MTEKPFTVFTKQFSVRYSETAPDGCLKPVYIFKYFQDAASEHAYQLGVSALHLLEWRRAWVMLGYRVVIDRYPRWDETVMLKTWRHPVRNLYELRAFEIVDDRGRPIAQGKSNWVMINSDTRKPVRLDRNMPPELMQNTLPLENDMGKLPGLDGSDVEVTFRVRRRDLDFNHHVNNTVYIEWALETGPEDLIADHRPCIIDVDYLEDVTYGSTIISQAQAMDTRPETTYLHRIRNDADDRELARLKIGWR
jgi:medium-chain acyl-[acyl-carrier-protein] hydrolase